MKKYQKADKKFPMLAGFCLISVILVLQANCYAAPPETFKFNVKHFSIEGSSPIPESFFVNYFKPLQNRSYTLKELQEVSKALEQQIHQQGYPLYRVIVPAQSLESGEIKLQITTENALNCKVPKP